MNKHFLYLSLLIAHLHWTAWQHCAWQSFMQPQAVSSSFDCPVINTSHFVKWCHIELAQSFSVNTVVCWVDQILQIECRVGIITALQTRRFIAARESFMHICVGRWDTQQWGSLACIQRKTHCYLCSKLLQNLLIHEYFNILYSSYFSWFYVWLIDACVFYKVECNLLFYCCCSFCSHNRFIITFEITGLCLADTLFSYSQFCLIIEFYTFPLKAVNICVGPQILTLAIMTPFSLSDNHCLYSIPLSPIRAEFKNLFNCKTFFVHLNNLSGQMKKIQIWSTVLHYLTSHISWKQYEVRRF